MYIPWDAREFRERASSVRAEPQPARRPRAQPCSRGHPHTDTKELLWSLGDVFYLFGGFCSSAHVATKCCESCPEPTLDTALVRLSGAGNSSLQKRTNASSRLNFPFVSRTPQAQHLQTQVRSASENLDLSHQGSKPGQWLEAAPPAAPGAPPLSQPRTQRRELPPGPAGATPRELFISGL